MSRARRTQFGSFSRSAKGASKTTYVGFKPVTGWVEQEDIDTPPSSMVSGQNVWVRHGRLIPRERVAAVGTGTPTPDIVNGAFIYNDITGTKYAVATSQDTVSYLAEGGSWTALTYVSGTSNIPPSGGERNYFFGDSVYLPRVDANLMLFTNGVDPIFAWQGPSSGTGFSTLTQAPIARDLTLFDNSPVAWNIRELSQSTRWVTRVQWATITSSEDWTTISNGAGFEDLVDMRGEGTRIITNGDRLVLATDQEIWTGRRTGGAFRFQFDPLIRTLGMPFPRAVLNTPHGVFWLNSDYMVYRLAGNQVEPVGQPILRELRDTLQDFDKAFFSWDPERAQVVLYYSATNGSYPQRAFTYHVDSQVWTPQRFSHNVTNASVADVVKSVVTWGGLSGTVGSIASTYQQLLGQDGVEDLILYSSGGTALVYNSANSLDENNNVVTSQWVSGAIFGGDPLSQKLAQVVRLDVQADSASSISVAVSGNLGNAYGTETKKAFSVRSETSQLRVPMNVAGQYHALRVQSDTTGWRFNRAFVRAVQIGRFDY